MLHFLVYQLPLMFQEEDSLARALANAISLIKQCIVFNQPRLYYDDVYFHSNVNDLAVYLKGVIETLQ